MLVLPYRALPEPLKAERAISTGSHAFFIYKPLIGSQEVITLIIGMKYIPKRMVSFSPKSWIISTLCLFGILSVVSSCSSAKTIGLSCNERQIEIFVDDEYLGRDLVYYTVPKGRKTIEVSCRENGIEVYHRRINVADKKGRLIELQIPKNYQYSSKPY